jgi:hypothetical protein
VGHVTCLSPRAFDFDLSWRDRARYSVRETLLQFHESDADFIRRPAPVSFDEIFRRSIRRIHSYFYRYSNGITFPRKNC